MRARRSGVYSLVVPVAGTPPQGINVSSHIREPRCGRHWPWKASRSSSFSGAFTQSISATPMDAEAQGHRQGPRTEKTEPGRPKTIDSDNPAWSKRYLSRIFDPPRPHPVGLATPRTGCHLTGSATASIADEHALISAFAMIALGHELAVGQNWPLRRAAAVVDAARPPGVQSTPFSTRIRPGQFERIQSIACDLLAYKRRTSTACTPGFVSRDPCGPRGGGHPSRTAVADSLQRSTRRLGRAALERLRGAPCGVPS